MSQYVDLKLICTSVDVGPVDGYYRSVAAELYEVDTESLVSSLIGKLIPEDIITILGDDVDAVLDSLGEDYITRYLELKK